MGIGTSVSKAELNEIASHPERNVFVATSFEVLESKVNEIIDRVCYPGRPVMSFKMHCTTHQRTNVGMYRVRTGPGKSGKSWNFVF